MKWDDNKSYRETIVGMGTPMCTGQGAGPVARTRWDITCGYGYGIIGDHWGSGTFFCGHGTEDYRGLGDGTDLHSETH